ncbi:MAG: small conductance mechanosensitive channel [Glaciecola sp.]
MPDAIAWAINILLAALILIIGFWIAGPVYKAGHAIGKKYEKLDDTLFCFFGSITRYVLLAFALIAILGRIGAETTSIVALIGLAYNDNTDDARKVIEGV